MRSVSRRRFLQLSAGAAAAATLATSCGTGSDPTGDDDGDGIANADETTTTLMSPQKRSRLSEVQHVVIMIQGGASFDQVFGTRPDVRGFDDPDVLTLPSGRPIWNQPDPSSDAGWVLPFPLAEAVDGCVPLLDDRWDQQHQAVDAGRMDRFAIEFGAQTMGYYRRDDLPFYASLADEFTVCDSWFSSVLGPANPNRLEAVTGTIDPLAKAGGPATSAWAATYAWETYPERLLRAGIDWRVYHDAGSSQNNPLAAFVQFQEAAEGTPLWDSAMRDRTIEDFEADCEDGSLPWVSWVVAPDAMTDIDDQQAFAAQHLAAITANADLWSKTLVILTHASSGGYFDHVPPPTPPIENLVEYVDLQPIGFGPRVPALLVSPWTRGGRVNSDVLDHTSILKLLEHRFGVVAPLISTWRRETAGDLLDALDFANFDPTVPTIARPKPVPAERSGAAACAPGSIAPPADQAMPATE